MTKAIVVAAMAAALLAGCDAATAPELEGRWGGPDATLTLSPLGGSVEYACGAGTIEAGWTLDARGRWEATGQHSVGGGPLPVGGRPPHPATYSGLLAGATLTFTVDVPELDLHLGPFRVTRNAEGQREICL